MCPDASKGFGNPTFHLTRRIVFPTAMCHQFDIMAAMRIPYSACELDRAAQLRGDPAWVAARLAEQTTRFAAVWRNRNHIVEAPDPAPALLHGAGASQALELAEEVVFLGLLGEEAVFALDLSPLDEEEALAAVGGRGGFRDLREIGPRLRQDDGALLAYARGIVYWHGRHRYCGRCGYPSEAAEAGHGRVCANPDCRSYHFPRTDPAVIMLVHDGADRCVLGRSPRFPPGMVSTLAGFVEPGESLEDAVAREVAEEVGLAVAPGDVRYFGSQPWPFPSSLMLGFHARAAYDSLTVDPDELEHARWFHRADVLNAREDDDFKLPRRDSIARRLIEAWLAEGG